MCYLGNVKDVDIAGLNGGHRVCQGFHEHDELVCSQWPAWQDMRQWTYANQNLAFTGKIPSLNHKQQHM
jgi:hypothetical protein